MCYSVITTDRFEADVLYYLKKKKFKNILDDINEVIKQLKQGNLIGDSIPSLSFNLNEHAVKVRVANSDTKDGKSNGYRLIYYVIKDDKEIYLLTVYYKKEDNRIPSNKEIENLIKKYVFN